MRDEPPAPDDTDPESEEQHGTLRPTSVAALAGWAVVGLVCGWAAHPVSERLGNVAPVVSWLQPLTLWLLAATDLSVLQLQIIGVTLAVALPIAFYPVAVCLWMVIDITFHPPDKESGRPRR